MTRASEEEEEEEAAPTRRLFLKKRLVVPWGDGCTQGKGNKRVKHAHNLASIGAVGVATSAGEHNGKHDANSARMAEDDTENAREERPVSVELQGQEQPEGCEGLTLKDWAEEAGIPAESIVAASAMFMASRAEGVHGVSLAQFLGALLGEFGVDIDVCSIPIPSADTPVPFLSPPPQQAVGAMVFKYWKGVTTNFANLRVRGACDSGRVDFRVSSGVISGECNLKSDEFTSLDLAQVLERVPIESIAHFVVVTSISEDIAMRSNEQIQWPTVVYRISRGSDPQLISMTDTPNKLLLLIELKRKTANCSVPFCSF